ncbi:MAG: acyl carrier protein [Bryobacteraceae bacterium]
MPVYTEEFIKSEVKRVVAEVTEREVEEIGDAMDYREELGVDSLTALEIMFDVDRKFGIEVPDEEYQQLKNVNETVALIIKYLPADKKSTEAA